MTEEIFSQGHLKIISFSSQSKEKHINQIETANLCAHRDPMNGASIEAEPEVVETATFGTRHAEPITIDGIIVIGLVIAHICHVRYYG